MSAIGMSVSILGVFCKAAYGIIKYYKNKKKYIVEIWVVW